MRWDDRANVEPMGPQPAVPGDVIDRRRTSVEKTNTHHRRSIAFEINAVGGCAGETTGTDPGHARRNEDAEHIALCHGVIADGGDAVAEVDEVKPGALIKRHESDIGHTIAHGHQTERSAMEESIVADVFDTVGDRDARQRGVLKRVGSNGHYREAADLGGNARRSSRTRITRDGDRPA